MEMKVNFTPVQNKKSYSEPKLVLHGNISEITQDLMGPGKHLGWKKRKEHHS